MEWYLDAITCTIYHHMEGVWTKYEILNVGRLRFQVDAHSCVAPNQYTHVGSGCEWARYMEIVGKHAIRETPPNTEQNPIHYTSRIGDSCQILPRNIQCLVGNIPEMDMPDEWDDETPQDIIVATDGSVVFGVGCHSWVVSSENEHILVFGGGPDGGDQSLMTSYCSELRDIAIGLAVIGALARSGKVKVRSFKLVHDNEASI
jgi:hypothetical protein